MIHIGNHGEQMVYEPINHWLKSPEAGLRYHRSMNEDDVYDGCLDMATFGRPVVGPLSDDQKWLVNPPTYDPTRPPRTSSQGGEIPEQHRHSLSTPTGEPQTLGQHVSTATDVEIGMMAELGAAITLSLIHI